MHRKASMLCMLAALLSFGSVAFAQEQTVSIQGVVKDASGAVLPGATVEARNPLAGTNTAVTNADGVYRFPALPPGKYEITSTLQGFKPDQAHGYGPRAWQEPRHRSDDGAGLGHRGSVGHRRVVADHRRQRQRRHAPRSPAAPSSACRRAATSRRFFVRRRAPRPSRSPAAPRSTARPALRTASSSTGWTPPTCRPASLARRCCSTSSTKCRSSRPATTPSSAAPPAASSTC